MFMTNELWRYFFLLMSIAASAIGKKLTFCDELGACKKSCFVVIDQARKCPADMLCCLHGNVPDTYVP
ncbi:uncharacterized protein DMAD_10923 [Drosophila madeirensis]|uniref:Beta-defensin n=1 Tax=Drosophila madeirensis TaxID=30013 RepID=A0AAU9FBF4_DROMD